MVNIKSDKKNYDDALLSANKLFENDINMQSDLVRLQNIMQKYSNLDPDKLSMNRATEVSKELKKAKQFK